MKIALDWIAEYLTPVPEASVAAEALMNGGLPVESVEEGMGAKGLTKILDVEVTSNRTDCLCHVGLARELSALVGGSFALPVVALQEAAGAGGAAELTAVGIEDLGGCPYYSARVIRGVKVGPSPDWLRRRLESIGLRPANNVVDVTNYVLMELGQPLHAFDFDGLAERRIVVRRARGGEKMLAIDGREYALEPSMLVIADAHRPVAIAGVMGGKATEVTERTVNVLLESARFEPLTVRSTSRALGLKSDASYRFERGIDPAMAELASQRAAQLILEVAGGQLARGVVAAGSLGIPAHPPTVAMRLGRFKEIVGIGLAPERALAILTALGFAAWLNENAAGAEDVVGVRVPTHRLDVSREIDLIEEVARVHGYGHVPTLDRVMHTVKGEPAREKAVRAIRSAMVEAGFSEAVTVTFITEAEGKAFLAGEAAGSALIHPQHGGWKAEVLRPSLLPSLLAVRRTNQYAGIADARVFEMAETYLQVGDVMKVPPTQRRRLSAVAGDLAALTALLTLLPDRLNPAARMWVQPKDWPFYVKGASAEVMLEVGGKRSVVGHVGMVVMELQKQYDLRHGVAGLELDAEALVAIFEPVRRAHAVPRYPGVTRDLSVVVEEAVRWADVESVLAGAKLACLEKIDFVTTFRSKQVAEGKKSLTLTLDFRDPGRTLTSGEVDAQVGMAVAMLRERFGAVLRA